MSSLATAGSGIGTGLVARAAGSGGVEHDRPAGLGKPLLGRAPHVGVAAEAVDQEQGVPVALLAEVQPQPAYGDEAIQGQGGSSGSQAGAGAALIASIIPDRPALLHPYMCCQTVGW